MLYREVFKVVGNFLFFFAFILFVPLGLCLYYQFFAPENHPQPHASLAFVETIITTFMIAGVFLYFGRKARGKIFRREGILIVALIWLLASLIASFPFYFSGTLQNPVQAFFEAASGFTTTGSTVMEPKRFDASGKEIPYIAAYPGLEQVEYSYYGTITPVGNLTGINAVSRGLIFWRSLIQWLGGLGIMVLFVAILPAMGVGGKVLMQSEVTGPIKSAMTPRVNETAIQLWKIYMGLTLIEVLLLYFTNGNVSLFDATIVSLSSISTGGFAPHSESIEYWNNPVTDWIIIVFMVLGSVNFTLFYYCLRGQFYKLWNTELFVFLMIILFLCIMGTYQLVGTPIYLLDGSIGGIYDWWGAFTDGSFQLVAALTSTGFYTTNYTFWPYVTQVLMLISMFIGGMSASTAGGIKIIRHIIIFLLAKTRIESSFRPDAVKPIKVDQVEVDSGTLINVLCFFFFAISISVIGTYLYSTDGIDPETSMGLTACMINNVGLAFRQAGVMGSCAFLSDFSCLLSCLLMFLGRLEFLVILVLFLPSFWKEER